MTPAPTTVQEYLAALPEDRRRTVRAIRSTIRKTIDPAFREGLQSGGIGWHLPHSAYPEGYHCDPEKPLPFATIASQKNHVALYFFGLYCDPKEEQAFRRDWLASGKKLDMGRACIRVKELDDVPLDVIGKAFARLRAEMFVQAYESALAAGSARRKTGPRKGAKRKAATRKKTGPE